MAGDEGRCQDHASTCATSAKPPIRLAMSPAGSGSPSRAVTTPIRSSAPAGAITVTDRKVGEVAECRVVHGALRTDGEGPADLGDDHADLTGGNLHPRVLGHREDGPELEADFPASAGAPGSPLTAEGDGVVAGKLAEGEALRHEPNLRRPDPFDGFCEDENHEQDPEQPEALGPGDNGHDNSFPSGRREPAPSTRPAGLRRPFRRVVGGGGLAQGRAGSRPPHGASEASQAGGRSCSWTEGIGVSGEVRARRGRTVLRPA
jgi:hypothetical protein